MMTHLHSSLRAQATTVCRVVSMFLLTALLLGMGCAARSDDQSKNSAPTNAQAHQQAKAADKGIFKVYYAPAKNPSYKEIQEDMKKERLLESIAADLNQVLTLPTDITLVLTECGEVNAFYQPDKQQIQLCYELIEHYSKAFAPDLKSEDELASAVAGATMHTFYHELGHALIHVLDLPVTGKEEDAVDQLATLILADGTPEGEQAVIDAANMFLIEDKQNDTDIEHLAFWDEHSLDAQRFYNIICWLYGHDEKRYAGLVKAGTLPEDRAARCAGEYQQIDKSWSRLLEAHLKK